MYFSFSLARGASVNHQTWILWAFILIHSRHSFIFNANVRCRSSLGANSWARWSCFFLALSKLRFCLHCVVWYVTRWNTVPNIWGVCIMEISWRRSASFPLRLRTVILVYKAAFSVVNISSISALKQHRSVLLRLPYLFIFWNQNYYKNV